MAGMNAQAQIKIIDKDYANKIADAIYKAEGGAKTKYPYGIKSIDTKGNKEYARRICLNTINNQYIRWQKSGKTNSFLESLAARYCPVNDKEDKNKLNENWLKNVEYFLSQ